MMRGISVGVVISIPLYWSLWHWPLATVGAACVVLIGLEVWRNLP